MEAAGQESTPASYPRVKPDFKSELESFRTETLAKADTQEKNCLPTAADVQSEKAQRSVIEGIEGFDASRLKHAETKEKNPLPDVEGRCLKPPHWSPFKRPPKRAFAVVRHTTRILKMLLTFILSIARRHSALLLLFFVVCPPHCGVLLLRRN